MQFFEIASVPLDTNLLCEHALTCIVKLSFFHFLGIWIRPRESIRFFNKKNIYRVLT